MGRNLPFQRSRDLVPGVGFSGATSQPASVGDSGDPAYDMTPGARWTAVPYQTLTTRTTIGVVTFHIAGISHVAFSLEDGPWRSVTSRRVNPDSGVYEYCVSVDPSSVTPGLVELRAIAYPLIGVPRILETLYLYFEDAGTPALGGGGVLYVSSSGTDGVGRGTTTGTPLATLDYALGIINANLATYDGGAIAVMLAGEYVMGEAPSNTLNDRWITIRPHSGVADSSVIIHAGDPADYCRPKVRRLRFERVALDLSDMLQMYKEDTHQQWYDRSHYFQTGGREEEHLPYYMIPVRNTGYGGLFYTECTANDSYHAFLLANLVRNCDASELSSDAFQNSLCVVNSTIDDHDGELGVGHADAFQYFEDVENVIVYNCRCRQLNSCQNVFLNHTDSSFTNMFFVNVAFENGVANPPFSVHYSACTHLVFSHCTFGGQRLILADETAGADQFFADNVAYLNCVFHQVTRDTFGNPGLPSGVTMTNCHFVTGTPRGTGYSEGTVTMAIASDFSVTYSGSDAADLLDTAATLPAGLGIGSTHKGARYT